MPVIRIQLDSVRQQGSRLSQAASDLTALHWEINRLANQLDWEVRGKGHVEAKIGEAATLGKKLYEEAQRLSEYLKTCAAALEDADSQGQQGISATMSTASLSTGLVVGSSAVGAGVLAGVIAGNKSAGASTTNLKWVKKCIQQESPQEPQQLAKLFSEFKTANSAFLKKYPAGEPYAGEYATFQCRGFVRQYYKDVLSIEDTMKTGAHQYELIFDNSSITQVGQVVSQGTVSADDVKQLFSDASVGDIIQMNGSKGLHSAIFGGLSADGHILFFDANFVPPVNEGGIPNLVQYRVKSTEEFASYISCSGGGVTVYTAGK